MQLLKEEEEEEEEEETNVKYIKVKCYTSKTNFRLS
jgi:hypothetical protein